MSPIVSHPRHRHHRNVGGAAFERALLTTSDFPTILGDTVGRTLRQAYGAAPAGIRRLARQTTARDFRAKYRVQLSAAPTLAEANEDGELIAGRSARRKSPPRSPPTAGSSASAGRLWSMTTWAPSPTCLAAWAGGGGIRGRQAGGTGHQQQRRWADRGQHGDALFHADHGNLAASGGVISRTTLFGGPPRHAQPGRACRRTDFGHAALSAGSRRPKRPRRKKPSRRFRATTTAEVNPFSSLVVVSRTAAIPAIPGTSPPTPPKSTASNSLIWRANRDGRPETKVGFYRNRRRASQNSSRLRLRLRRFPQLVSQPRRLIMADLSDLQTRLDTLQKCRASGIRTVEYDGRRIEYENRCGDGCSHRRSGTPDRRLAGQPRSPRFAFGPCKGI